ncbi:TPA: hypothetical protein QC311_000234 [Bacillus cereus]|nr:hypothetical protein [Bacillus cereus]HDR8459430.1 hypothetical protein [Bacillus cereus]
MPKWVDIAGECFGMLTVLGKVKKGRLTYWECRCECGVLTYSSVTDLRAGKKKSCGCLAKKKRKLGNPTHELKNINKRLYTSWKNMKSRCLNEKNKSYRHYGGKGVVICEAWLSYEIFYNWSITNGYEDNLTLDRIDNDGNYELNNCRWVDVKTQVRNRSITAKVLFHSKEIPIAELAEEYGIDYLLVKARHNRGFKNDELIKGRKKAN